PGGGGTAGARGGPHDRAAAGRRRGAARRGGDMTMSALRPPSLRPGAALGRTVGTAAGSALALALLTCGCVFAALAGPALSLHTRTQALDQTVAGFASTTKTVQVTGSWGDFTGSLQAFQPGQNLGNVLPRVISDVGHGLRATP